MFSKEEDKKMPGRTKMRKAILAVFLALVVAAGTAAYAQAGSDKEDEVLKLSLADALKMAEENNPQIELAKLGLKKAELAMTQLKYRDKKVKDQEEELEKLGLGGSITDNFEYQYSFQLGKKQADNAIALAKANIDATLRSIRFGTEAYYYMALAARETVRNAEKSLERQKEMLKIAEAKFKEGTITRKEVLDTEVELAKVQASLTQAKAQEEKAYNNLKKLLGIDMNRAIELVDEFDYTALEEEPDLEKMLKEAEQNRIDLIQARGSLEVAQLDFDLTSKVYPENTFIYAEKQYALQEAKMQLESVRDNVETEVRSIILDLTEAQANIPLLDKTLEMARESLRLAKLSFEAGIARSVDVSAAEEGLRQVEFQRAQAIYNYNLAKLKLQNVIYIPVTATGVTSPSTQGNSPASM